MRITSITVRNYRIHQELTVELDRSLTVVGGPNEVGKSTLVEAAHRALFLKARTTGEAQKSMVSTVHAGHPEVEVCFESGGQSYRVLKRFNGQSGTATLTVVGGETWHGDEAESRQADILGVEAATGGRGAGERVAQQWAHLWVWQGQAGEDPTQHATVHKDSLLARLQGSGVAAAMQSELDANVAAAMAKRHDELFTKNGSPRKDSDAGRAVQAAEAATSGLQQAQTTFDALLHAVADSQQAGETIESCQRDLSSLRAELVAVNDKLEQVTKLRSQEQSQAADAEKAATDHGTLEQGDNEIRKTRENIRTRSEALQPKNEETNRLLQEHSECRDRHAQAEKACREASTASRSARLRRELATACVNLFERTAQRELLDKKSQQVQQAKDHLTGLQSQLATVPVIGPAELKSLQKLERKHSNAEAALQAMATGIEVLSSDTAVQVGDRTLEVGQSQIVTEDSEVAVGSGTRLRIAPGGGTSLADARKRAQDVQDALQQKLDALRVRSVAEAAEMSARRQQLEAAIGADEARLAALSAETIEEDVAEAENARVTAESDVQRQLTLVEGLSPPANLDEARVLLEQSSQRLRDAETQEEICQATRDRAAQELQDLDERLTKHRKAILEEQKALTGLEANLRLLLDKYGEDAIRSERLAELFTERTRADQCLAGTRRAIDELQPNLLESDRSRLQRAVDQCDATRIEAEKKLAVARSILHRDGSSDPQAALALSQAKSRSAGERLASLQRRANAVRLLHALFQREQRALSEELTRPFAEKISGYLRCLFGASAEVRVRLEANAFVGLELARPGQAAGSFSFDSLSAGAKEQMAAAVRLAMAEVLAEGHDQCLPLVFDDAFAYSDPDRVMILQRMLDRAASRGLQIIVLSCNPSDYAALGAKLILLSRESRTHPQTARDTDVLDSEETEASLDAVDGLSTVAGQVTDEQRQALISALQSEGGSKGNQSLRQLLGWDASTYEAVKNDLVAAGQLTPGRGRGGSVTLAHDPDSGGSPSLTE